MESEAKYMIVGVAVLSFIALLIVFLLWVANNEDQSQYRSYKINFYDHSLRGLQVGSNVTMRGIRVGSVENIAILGKEHQGVRVKVNVHEDAQVTSQTRAIIETNILTGLSTVELTQDVKSSAKAALLDNGNSEIQEGEAQLNALKNSLSDILANLAGSLKRIEQLLSEENQQSYASILKNIDSITAGLAKDPKGLSRLLEEAASLLNETRSFMGNTNKSLNESIVNMRTISQSLALDLNLLARSISDAAKAISSTVKRYDDPRSIILGPNPEAYGPGEEKLR